MTTDRAAALGRLAAAAQELAAAARALAVLESAPPPRPRGRPRAVRPAPPAAELVTIIDTAHRLGIGRSTVYKLLAAGELRSVHVLVGHRVVASSVDEYLRRLGA